MERKDIRKRKREKGFTLIELMIVVAIIAILAAIAIPQFKKYVKTTKEVGVAANCAAARNFIKSEIYKANASGDSLPSASTIKDLLNAEGYKNPVNRDEEAFTIEDPSNGQVQISFANDTYTIKCKLENGTVETYEIVAGEF